ncbi:hypothetical protein J7T55_007854 [Diaporthe amygdali]|uniref:uncharacterized protein n=1 Tax=Phomopsis amygdali TaxID=1214568 RepID=UPI0022FDD387|nr:uncharacterized protein J7T55_007854 [Diaporthe amygdali]KAJ0114020.1 hypothetical protein J7T55_007854 [Diaporthe amygdali]
MQHFGESHQDANEASASEPEEVEDEIEVEAPEGAENNGADEGPPAKRRKTGGNLECVYDERKLKPGLRSGAIEHLSQRITALENMFLGQGMLWQQNITKIWRRLDDVAPERVSNPSPPDSGCSMVGTSLQECTAQLRKTLSSASGDGNSWALPPSEKETSTRVHDVQHHQANPLPSRMDSEHRITTGDDNELPPDDVLFLLVETYFRLIHPWIPMLHVRNFRQRMKDPLQRSQITTICHAIISICARFSNDPRLGQDSAARDQKAKRSRDTVILQSMQSFSVENLQALIIIAFDTIGSGRSPSAWSVVGSMTRTVEQLQLSVEPASDEQSRAAEMLQNQIKRVAFLPPARDWSELEERRRVFWNVFLMDRFCSIATGWNLSLTSADVRRRLPCEGALWEAGDALETPTPFFGVSEKYDQTSTTSPSLDPRQRQKAQANEMRLPTARVESEDQESLGGFAYCIEATESLSLVTSFFLQQAVDVSKAQDVQMWLMRFKQLDLRLVQWKIFLPERWREACALNEDGNMDPNLTLAHITHNVAVILLHQGIAYPSAKWQSVLPTIGVRLPSASSAETCLLAATEVVTIVERFLRDNPVTLTNPQFAFCLFICGRMLLAHTAYYSIPLPREFDVLLDSLWEISKRWNLENNIAAKFASRLVRARQQGASLDIRQAVFSDDQAAIAHNSSKSQLHGAGVARQRSSIPGSHKSQPLHPMTKRSQAMPGPFLQERPGTDYRHRAAAQTPLGGPSVDIQIPINGGNSTNIGGSSHSNMRLAEEESPESISFAFPPLPLAFQAGQIASATQTAIQSPAMQPAPYPVQDFGNGMVPMDAAAFQDIDFFLEYSFPPDKRVSMYAQSSDQNEATEGLNQLNEEPV